MTLARPKNPGERRDGAPNEPPPEASTSHARQIRDADIIDLPVEIGEHVAGKYRVDALIGAGGMGIVMAAHDVMLDRPVAVKFLHGLNSTTLEANSRFKREARAMAKLHSEHVVRVLDVGTMPSGEPYMVMEYLDGTDLGALVKKCGFLPVGEAVDYLLAACEAVAEAHVLGIVHRDLKPSNLYLANRLDGTSILKLLDFGIAKFSSDTGDDEQSFTTTTALLGSPVYMSPEQLQCSRDADARADIWSLGAIIYRLVAGRPPFVASTMPQICTMILTTSPQPLTELVADVPPSLDAVVLRCLEKNADDRYPNVGELARALAPFGTGRAQSSVERAMALVYARGGTPPPPEPMPVRLSASGPQPAPVIPAPPPSKRMIDVVDADTTKKPVIQKLQGMSSRTLLLGSLAVSVLLGFVMGLVFWLHGRSSPPEEESFGGSQAVNAVATTPTTPRTAAATTPPPPQVAAPPLPVFSVEPRAPAPPVPAAGATSIPVSSLPTAAPPAVVSRPPRRPPGRPPRADTPPPAPAPPPPAPGDNSEFGGRK